MPTLQSLGIGSGLEIDTIITAIVDAEKVPKTLALTQKQETFDTKISELGTVKNNLADLQSKVNALKLTSNFDKYTATSGSTSVFTASASSLAEPGNYKVQVNQVASEQILASTSFTNINDAIGTGTLTLRFGTTDYDTGTDDYNSPFDANSTSLSTKTITINSSNNTVSSLRDYINAGDYNLSASIINDGGGYRLVLTANSGEKNSVEISVDDADSTDTDMSGLSQLAFNGSATNMLQTQAGADAELKINGLDITRESNTVSEAITGVTVTLNKADVGVNYNLTIARDSSTIEDQITALVDSFNTFAAHISDITKYDSSTGETGILIGDTTLRNLYSQVRSTLFSAQAESTGSVRALADMGILSNEKTGQLEVDEDKLATAISSNIEDVRALFASTGTGTDSLVKFVSNNSLSVAGTYAVNVTTIATKGTFTGTSVLPDFTMGGSIDIDADNNNFSIRINGTTSSSITLTAGNYTSGSTLAAEIQKQINADDNLKDAGTSIAVSYESASNRFVITSPTYGSTSTIAFLSVDTNSLAELGFDAIGGTNGVNVAGTINGKAATGSGQFLVSTEGDSIGIKVGILGGATGARGSVTFTRGIADQLYTLADSYTKTDGTLANKTDSLTDSSAAIDTEFEKLDYRIETLQAQLLKQFTAMDTVVNQLNSLSSFLTNALAVLPLSPTASSSS
jgi:flagellar hook-associated protein 2